MVRYQSVSAQCCVMSKMKNLQTWYENLKFKKPSYHKGTLVLSLTWNKSRQCKKKYFAQKRKYTSDFVRVLIFFLLVLFHFYFISWQHIYNSSRKVKFLVLDLRHNSLTSLFMMDQSAGDWFSLQRPIVCLTVAGPWITFTTGVGTSPSIIWLCSE